MLSRLPMLFALIAGTSLSASLAASAQEIVTTIAGQPGVPGTQDGASAQASFSDPAGLAVAGDGTVFISDFGGHTIRRIAPDGQVSLFAGSPNNAGMNDGPGLSARFDSPAGLAFLADGSLLVADLGNHVLRKITSGGAVTVFAGSLAQPGFDDGPALQARFNHPVGLAVDADGNVWVADGGNHLLRRIGPAGEVSTAAGRPEVWGALDGLASVATFHSPVALALDPVGNVFVADANNHVIRRRSVDGAVTTVAGAVGEAGYVDGASGIARFNRPAGLAFDRAGRLLVLDAGNHTLRRVTIGSTILVETISGNPALAGWRDGANRWPRFQNPFALALDPRGYLLISDSFNQVIRQCHLPVELRWVGARQLALLNGVADRSYRLETTAELGIPAWSLTAETRTDAGGAVVFGVPGGDAGTQYFRVEIGE